MKFNKIYLVICIVFIVFIHCSHAGKHSVASGDKDPSWVNNPHDMYPQQQYFTGVGTGDTRDAAENTAIGSIAKIFKSQVRVSQSIHEAFLESGNNIESESQLRRNTRIGTNLELKNVKVQQSHFSSRDGLYYVLATLDRMETAGLYKEDIVKNNRSISENYLDAQNEGDKIKKYVLLSRSQAVYEKNNDLKEVFRILMPGNSMIPETVSGDDLNKELNQVKGQISAGLDPGPDCPPAVTDYMREFIGRIGFPMKEGQTDFSFKYNLDMNPAQMNRDDVVGFNWKLTVEIVDNLKGSSMKAFNIDNRTLGISKEQAEAKIMRTVQDEIVENLYTDFIQYMSKK